jgi:hypothetical protein
MKKTILALALLAATANAGFAQSYGLKVPFNGCNSTIASDVDCKPAGSSNNSGSR